MSKWLYKGKSVMEPPEGVHGFIYKIEWEGGYYIGAKSFYSNTTIKLSKKKSNELYTGKGRKPTKQKQQKSSNWKVYPSSSIEVKKLVEEKGEAYFKWEIIDFAKNKSELAYKETQYIICNNILYDERCWNGWVTAKIHKKNLK